MADKENAANLEKKVVSREIENDHQENDGPDSKPQSAKDKTPAKANPIQKWTIRVLALALVYFIWYLVADRLTPMTNEARVRGFVVPVASQVNGEIVEVAVGINERVEPGQTIIRINPRDFELAVEQAEAELESAGQEMGAGTAAIATAQAALTSAEANYESVQANANRVFEMVERGVISQSDGDRARGMLGQAEAAVASAEAELERAKQQLGQGGLNNPRIREAMAKLEQAQIDLERTHVIAPAEGVVTNMNLEVGLYARTGDPMFTFLSIRDVWLEAYMRENNISNIEAGDPVEIVLDVAPGKIFTGEVSSIGYGVNWDQATRPGELPVVSSSAGWMGERQRFPVVINFTDPGVRGRLREGGQAEVIIYTGNNALLNGLGKLSIRIRSYLSYLN